MMSICVGWFFEEVGPVGCEVFLVKMHAQRPREGELARDVFEGWLQFP